ncbi:MAG: hypothetical protein ACOVOT_05755 [Rubrivivax sp.]|jgi:hypothetical protein|nr:hypothetical protein [Rubrivivax sp.]
MTHEPQAGESRTLADALQQVGDDLRRQSPPPFQSFWPAAAPHPGRPVSRGVSANTGGGRWRLAACLGVVLLSLTLTLQPWRPGPSQPALAELAPVGFVPVASAERWVQPDQGVSRGWLVRTELPAERLVSLGLPYDPGRAAARVPAELLMDASGEVLAVRVLP